MTGSKRLLAVGILLLTGLGCSSSRDKAPEQVAAENAVTEEKSDAEEQPVADESPAVKKSPAATGKSSAKKAVPPKGEAVTAWRRLRAVGCDGKLAGIWTPVQAMIVRDAPRAIGNGPIRDTRVRVYYEQAHEGYDGTHQGLLNLERDVGKCMARMKGWEEALRETTSWALEAGVEGRLLQSVEAFHFLQEATKDAKEYPFGVVDSGVETNGRTWVKAYGKGCEPTLDGMGSQEIDPCLRLEISCWSTGPCTGQVRQGPSAQAGD